MDEQISFKNRKLNYVHADDGHAYVFVLCIIVLNSSLFIYVEIITGCHLRHVAPCTVPLRPLEQRDTVKEVHLFLVQPCAAVSSFGTVRLQSGAAWTRIRVVCHVNECRSTLQAQVKYTVRMNITGLYL